MRRRAGRGHGQAEACDCAFELPMPADHPVYPPNRSTARWHGVYSWSILRQTDLRLMDADVGAGVGANPRQKLVKRVRLHIDEPLALCRYLQRRRRILHRIRRRCLQGHLKCLQPEFQAREKGHMTACEPPLHVWRCKQRAGFLLCICGASKVWRTLPDAARCRTLESSYASQDGRSWMHSDHRTSRRQ